ncbi:hypothetical protein ACQEVB_31040 [Pseudonocardia sp. CA-107938]|uniref:hypothetical protein n=1 Tax=Pseudonocardia sp. CA-107938 TaxID=3240021 RepID=UPI003D93EDB1
MGELYQVLGKLIGAGGDIAHWDGTDLRTRVIEEVADVMGALEFFVATNELPRDIIDARAAEKLRSYNRWHLDHGGRLINPPAVDG